MMVGKRLTLRLPPKDKSRPFNGQVDRVVPKRVQLDGLQNLDASPICEKILLIF